MGIAALWDTGEREGRGVYRWTNVALFWPSVVYYAAFPQLADCLLNERVILSLDKLQWRLHEWMNEWKKEKKERKKWEKLGGNFRTIHWNCQLTSAEKGSTFSWALTYIGGGGIISMAFNTDTMTTSYKTLTLYIDLILVFFSLVKITLSRNNFKCLFLFNHFDI